MIGFVGNDAFGAKLIASLDQAGVDTSRLGISDRPTDCACIYVFPDGENSIVISPGANATVLDPPLVRALSPELLRNVDFLTPSQSAAALLGDPDLEIPDRRRRRGDLFSKWGNSEACFSPSLDLLPG